MNDEQFWRVLIGGAILGVLPWVISWLKELIQGWSGHDARCRQDTGYALCKLWGDFWAACYERCRKTIRPTQIRQTRRSEPYWGKRVSGGRTDGADERPSVKRP